MVTICYTINSLQHLPKGVVAQILNHTEELTMNVIALVHEIKDERPDFLESMPIDDVKSFCKANGYKITKVYDDDGQLINDIKLKKIRPKRIVFWGTYEDYPELDRLCNKLGINLITIFPMLV
uniref:Uncharacterized protein n=2 Tax=Bacillales TaxID=1385 RepID=A0A1C9LUN1_MAMSC|nr:hypothetical protein [Mammaliicoccus sciuri]